MRTIKQFLLLCLITLSFPALAQDDGKYKFSLEPLYGLETSYVRFPSPGKYVTRATYGLRAIYGLTLLSGEVEVTQAHSSQNYSGDRKVEDKTQNLALGVRSTYAMGRYLGFYLRAGGRATQGESKVTEAGVTETHDNPLKVNPYGGAGLQIAFSNIMALNLGATLIKNGEGKYDSQFTFGLTTQFGRF